MSRVLTSPLPSKSTRHSPCVASTQAANSLVACWAVAVAVMNDPAGTSVGFEAVDTNLGAVGVGVAGEVDLGKARRGTEAHDQQRRGEGFGVRMVWVCLRLRGGLVEALRVRITQPSSRSTARGRRGQETQQPAFQLFRNTSTSSVSAEPSPLTPTTMTPSRRACVPRHIARDVPESEYASGKR